MVLGNIRRAGYPEITPDWAIRLAYEEVADSDQLSKLALRSLRAVTFLSEGLAFMRQQAPVAEIKLPDNGDVQIRHGLMLAGSGFKAVHRRDLHDKPWVVSVPLDRCRTADGGSLGSATYFSGDRDTWYEDEGLHPWGDDEADIIATSLNAEAPHTSPPIIVGGADYLFTVGVLKATEPISEDESPLRHFILIGPGAWKAGIDEVRRQRAIDGVVSPALEDMLTSRETILGATVA